MKASRETLAREFLSQSRHSLARHHLPRIARCLEMLSEKEIWWRGNSASNSVGNLVLHLEGNVRQWIVSGLGEVPDQRQRDKEFSERGPIPRRKLMALPKRTVTEACQTLEKLPARELSRTRWIQGFRVSGFKAVAHVTEHFAYHAGQVAYATKLLRRLDLKFTRLPGEKAKKRIAGKLPTL